LAILRAVVVILALLGLVDAPPIGVDHGLHWALSTILVGSVVATLWRPLAGAALAALLLGMVAVVGNHGYELYPLMVATVAVVALEPPTTVVATIGAVLLLEALATTGQGSPAAAQTQAILTVICSGVGLAARQLLKRARVAHDRIDALERQTLAARRDERARLADDLSAILADTLEGNADELSATDADDRGETARATLAGVEATAVASLAQLRTLVTTLRGAPGPMGQTGSADPVAVAEEVEEVLAGHGFFTELDAADLPDGLPGYALDTVAILLREAGALVPRLGSPGGTCRLGVQATADALLATVGVPLSPAALATPGTLLGAVAVRADAVGGTLVEQRDGAEWTARLTLPLVTTPDHMPRAAPATPTGWRRALGPWLIVDSWAALAILGVGVAINAALALIALATGDADWPANALWALTFLGLALLISRPPIGVAVEGAVLALGLAVSPPTLLIGQAPQLAVFGLATWTTTRAARWPVVVLAGWVAYCLVWFGGGLTPADAASTVAYPLFGIASGLATRHFLELRRVQLAAFGTAAEAFSDARALERRQLAGELHDIVAHQLSLITLQVMANGSSHDPAVLSRTIRKVAGINRSAQADLGMLLHLLRDDAWPANPSRTEERITPSQALAGVTATLTDAGHPVEATLDPGVDAVDPTTQHTLTRILREASTNILRYAPARCRVQISLALDAENVTIQVTSPLAARTSRVRHSTGAGLLGLTERIKLTGGTFSAGPEGGCWRVRAVLSRAGMTAVEPPPVPTCPPHTSVDQVIGTVRATEFGQPTDVDGP